MQSRTREPNLALIIIVAAGMFAICSCNGFNHAKAPIADTTFQTQVKPLLEHRCVWCHGNEVTLGGLNFQNRRATIDSKSRFIVPGDPESSLIYVAVTRDPEHLKAMPGDGWSATTAQKDALHAWIKSGAPWPADRSGRIKRKSYYVIFEDYL